MQIQGSEKDKKAVTERLQKASYDKQPTTASQQKLDSALKRIGEAAVKGTMTGGADSPEDIFDDVSENLKGVYKNALAKNGGSKSKANSAVKHQLLDINDALAKFGLGFVESSFGLPGGGAESSRIPLGFGLTPGRLDSIKFIASSVTDNFIKELSLDKCAQRLDKRLKEVGKELNEKYDFDKADKCFAAQLDSYLREHLGLSRINKDGKPSFELTKERKELVEGLADGIIKARSPQERQQAVTAINDAVDKQDDRPLQDVLIQQINWALGKAGIKQTLKRIPQIYELK